MSLNDRGASGERDWEREVNEIAQKEMNEPSDPEKRRQFVEEIRHWITEHEDFIGRTDENFILQFLRVSKYKVEKAKKRIQRFYKIRFQERKWFERTDESESTAIELFSKGMIYLIKNNEKYPEDMVIAKVGSLDSKTVAVEQLAACAVQLIESRIDKPSSQTHGGIVIICVKGIGAEIILQATPLFLWRAIHCWQNVLPVRINSIHIVNASPIVYDAIRCAKTMLSKKMKSRFFVHKINTNTLTDIVNRTRLPDELGGTGGHFKTYAEATVQEYIKGKEVHSRNRKFSWIKGKISKQQEDNIAADKFMRITVSDIHL